MLTVLNVAYPFAPLGPDAVGGAEQVLTTLDAGLCRAGHRSVVIACEGSRVEGTWVATPPVRGVVTDQARSTAHALHRAAIRSVLASERVDVVHLHGVDFAAYLPEAGVPVLATLHLPPEWYPPEVFRLARPETSLHCVSASQRSRCPPGAVLLEDLPNGVDLDRFRPRGLPRTHALWLGRICPEKGVHLAVAAAQLAGVPLVVAGQVFPYPEHERYFETEVVPRLDAERRFLGTVAAEDKNALLASARCLVLPSVVPETSSLVAMEALASGTPVVASRQGAFTELIEPGRTGFLVDSVEELAWAIRAASSLDPGECRRVAEERFSSRRMCERYLAVYERLARRPVSPAHGSPSPSPRGAVVPEEPRAHVSRDHVTRLKMEEVRSRDALLDLTDEWRALWARCPEATVFQRPEWLNAWCAQLLSGEPRVLVLRRAGRLVGLAPLFLWQDRQEQVLSAMGGGVSDYVDVLFDPEQGEGTTAALAEWMGGLPWSRCEWSELRATSPLLVSRIGLGPEQLERQQSCPGLVLPGAAGVELRDVVPSRMAADAAYALRRAAREGLGAPVNSTAENFDELFDALVRLHAQRWGEKGSSGVLGAPAVQRFHRETARALLGSGLLVLFGLRRSADWAAVLYGFFDRRALRYYLSGFDPAFARLSPGSLVIAHALREALRRRCTLFDFLRGDEPYKRAWGARDVTWLYRRRQWPARPVGVSVGAPEREAELR